MSLEDMLRRSLADEFLRQGPAGIIVWYDKGATNAGLLPSALPEGAQLLPFEGSYLSTRLALERQDPRFDRKWVVYLPEAPPRESWLRDWELLGARWQMDLLELLHRQAGIPLTATLVELLRAHPENARELAGAWDSLIGQRTTTETALVDGLLALGFGLTSWDTGEGVLRFVNAGIDKAALAARGLWTTFHQRVADWGGWADLPDDEATLRQLLEASVLLTELIVSAPDLEARLAELLPAVTRRPAVAAVAAKWRDREDLRPGYLQAAQRVEQQHGLAALLSASESLMTAQTLCVVDDAWRQELREAVSPDGSNFKEKAGRVGSIAEARSQYFWARVHRAAYWEPIVYAAKLCQESQMAIEAAASLSDVDAFLQCYAAPEGWWRLDLWALLLAAKAQALHQDERKRYAHPAWRSYGEYLDTANKGFAQAAARDGWHPTQTGFWNEHVVGRRSTAVFLVDALRYDLAQYLMNSLSAQEYDISVSAMIGVLPSVTEVGMAALLPEAEQGLAISVENGALRVELSGENLASRQGRLALLTDRLADRGRVIDLSEVEESDVQAEEILVIQSRDIDEFGTFAADLQPSGLLAMVDNIVRAIGLLKDRGFRRFVVTADHGFLFLPPEVQPGRIQAPAAQLRKHRFAVGATQEGCLVLRAEEVGLGGDEILAFPMGLQVFGLPGETGAFLHGGLSLQECVIPVLQAEAVAPLEKVTVTMDIPAMLTSRIAVVTVRVEQATLFAQPRRVQLQIGEQRSEELELTTATRDVPIRVAWLDFNDQPPEEVSIRLLDADSRQILQECIVPVEMIV